MEKKPVTVKPNNRKAPRFGKRDFVYHVVRDELWEDWKKNTSNDLSFKEFKHVWDLIAEEVREQIIHNAQGVRLPFFNGDISLKYVEMREKPIDGASSIKAGRVVRYLDWHSNKRPGKICWVIKHAMTRNRWVQLYGFDACRKLEAMAISEGFRDNPGLYQASKATEFNKRQIHERD